VLEGRGVFRHVEGDTEAIQALQTNAVHYFQRPDASHLGVDENARSLSGNGGFVRFDHDFIAGVVDVFQKSFELGSLDGSCWKAAAEEVTALAAYALDVDILSSFGFEKAGGGFVDVGVESARQPFVAGYYDDQDVFLFALDQQRVVRLTGRRPRPLTRFWPEMACMSAWK
jgi:hypothetical protein